MGCSSSHNEKSATTLNIVLKKPAANFGRRADLDIANFTFSNRSNETLIRKSNEVFGQQFIIENCQSCDIYLLDHVGQTTIDFCKSCRIVTGPITGSIDEHFQSSAFSLWDNNWWSVYDFTPSSRNYSLAREPLSARSLFDSSPSVLASLVDLNLADLEAKSFVPVSCGPRAESMTVQSQNITIFIFLPNTQKSATSATPARLKDLVEEWRDFKLLRNCLSPLTAEKLRAIGRGESSKGTEAFIKSMKADSAGRVVVLEGVLEGGAGQASSSVTEIEKALECSSSEGTSFKSCYLVFTGAKATEASQLVFETLRVKT